jgi:D-amino peptidase
MDSFSGGIDVWVHLVVWQKPLMRSGLLFLIFAAGLLPQTPTSKKVFVIASLEGVDSIYNRGTQAVSLTAPRWAESCRLMTDDVNATVAGLFDGGATEVVVLDAYDTGNALSALDIHPKAILLSGRPMTPTLELNSSYSAVVFAGLPTMAGTENGVLANSYDFHSIQEIRVNNKPTGVIGARAMLAGHNGVPVIMMFGDETACQELHGLVPEAECAVIKWGLGGEGRSLGHTAAMKLIREKARLAMQRLPEIKPYKVTGPVEVRVELTTGSRTMLFGPREGVEQINARTWLFRGSSIVDAWLKFRGF